MDLQERFCNILILVKPFANVLTHQTYNLTLNLGNPACSSFDSRRRDPAFDCTSANYAITNIFPAKFPENSLTAFKHLHGKRLMGSTIIGVLSIHKAEVVFRNSRYV